MPRAMAMFTLLLVMLTSVPALSSDENPEGARRTAFGYSAGIGTMCLLGLDMKAGITPRASIETTLGVAFDEVFEDEARKFHAFGLGALYEPARWDWGCLVVEAGIWYLVGDTSTLELGDIRGDKHLCARAALGSEAWNGYFVSLGYVGSADVSDVMLRAGRRYYF